MVFGKSKLELKVGIFVFIGFIILMVFVFSIGSFRTWHSDYRLNFVFNFVNGVKLGSPVRFAGVDVGEVKSLEFVTGAQGNETKVMVKCALKNAVRIPGDSKVLVNTLGLLGEKYIEILPGSDYSKLLQGGEVVLGVDPVPMVEVTDMAKSIGSNINSILIAINKAEGTLGKLVYDQALYNNFEELSADIKKNPWKLFIKTKEKK